MLIFVPHSDSKTCCTSIQKKTWYTYNQKIDVIFSVQILESDKPFFYLCRNEFVG